MSFIAITVFYAYVFVRRLKIAKVEEEVDISLRLYWRMNNLSYLFGAFTLVTIVFLILTDG
jgi:hypothetical protein